MLQMLGVWTKKQLKEKQLLNISANCSNLVPSGNEASTIRTLGVSLWRKI